MKFKTVHDFAYNADICESSLSVDSISQPAMHFSNKMDLFGEQKEITIWYKQLYKC